MFISGKNARIYLQPTGADIVASTGYYDFDKMAVNWTANQTKSTATVPAYGQADVTLGGYAGFNVAGTVYLDLTPGRVTFVAVTNGGTGYTSAPTVAFSGGAGSGAAATAIIDTAGTVRFVVMTSFGTGYTSAPTVSFSGGAGSGAAATATINDYSDKVFNQLYGADNVGVKIALIGTTSSSKMPYYTGTITLTAANIAIPSNGAVAFQFSGAGTGSLTRAEY